MSFKEAYLAAAVDAFDIQGETATYHQLSGRVITLMAVIRENVEAFPTGFETSTPERRTEISLLKADAPRPRGGELVATDENTWRLETLLVDDAAKWTYSATRINDE